MPQVVLKIHLIPVGGASYGTLQMLFVILEVSLSFDEAS